GTEESQDKNFLEEDEAYTSSLVGTRDVCKKEMAEQQRRHSLFKRVFLTFFG
ncbi:hypothetical protein MKW92_023621, partial [Papaver armeniacum]